MSFRESVVDALRGALAEHLEALGPLDGLLSRPPKPEQGDLAFGCFPLAKLLRKGPPQIAGELAAKIEAGGGIARVEAAGPFVNFFSDPGAELLSLARDLASGEFESGFRTDDPAKIMVEFSQPNTHKTFHVGHLRNVCLGDALVRILGARGHEVVPVNYYGDFGIDVAKCLWWLRTHPELEAPATGRTAWLGDAYTKATAAVTPAEGDDAETEAAKKALHAEVREVLRGMEEGDPEIRALYEKTRQWCLDEFADVYGWFGVEFEHDFFESQLEEAGQAVVSEYLEKGVLVESRGAVICDLEEEGLVPALVRKSDGTSLYMTWDLALAKAKFDQFGIERSYYVVGAEQTLHFQQLFATLERMGYDRAKDCRHVSYELVMLPEGKMSSRKGTAIPLHELREAVVQSIRDKMAEESRGDRSDWDDARWEEVTRRIAVACLKYGMLRVGNTRRVIFQLEDWTSPEGDTGAYLLYSLARVAAIFRKAGGTPDPATLEGPFPEFGTVEERDLLGHLQTLPTVLARVERELDPSPIAGFLFDGAKKFSRFYQACPVLGAEEPLRSARLLLAHCVQQVFTEALSLLGIETVEAM